MYNFLPHEQILARFPRFFQINLLKYILISLEKTKAKFSKKIFISDWKIKSLFSTLREIICNFDSVIKNEIMTARICNISITAIKLSQHACDLKKKIKIEITQEIIQEGIQKIV